MRRFGSMAAIGLAAALMAPAGAAAKPAPAAPLTLEILDHAKLDKRTGVAHVRLEIRCAPFPAGYRVLFGELTGGQGDSPGTGGFGGRVICDGRKRVYTSDSFAPGVFGEPGPAWVKGDLDVTAWLLIESADGEINRSATDSETIKLR